MSELVVVLLEAIVCAESAAVASFWEADLDVSEAEVFRSLLAVLVF